MHNTNLKAFEGGDLYVSENDNGIGSLVGTSPDRIAQSVATDGSAAELIEQPSPPLAPVLAKCSGLLAHRQVGRADVLSATGATPMADTPSASRGINYAGLFGPSTLSLHGRAAQKVTVRISARTSAGARFGTTR